MKANPTKNRSGMTLLEILIAAGLLSMVIVCTLVLFSSTANMWAKGASGTGANLYACLAARKLVLDIEEAKSAAVDGSNLVVDFPYYDAENGHYERTSPGDTAVYYLSGETGAEPTGSYLWKDVAGVKTRLAKNVQSLSFTVTNETLVRFTLTGVDEAGGAVTPNIVQQSVKLRNG